MSREPTSLYAKAFVTGFSKPAYVLITAKLDGVLDEALFRKTSHALVEENPLLRSRVTSNLLGLPSHFVHGDVAEWAASCCFTDASSE